MENNTLCAMPFVGMMINTDGTMRTCCMASAEGSVIKENDKTLSVNVEGIASAWNGSHMRSTRRDMVAGKDIPACSECYRQERNGCMSHRQYVTNEWKQALGDPGFKSHINKAISADFEMADAPYYLDLRLGNLCNLKCRMCNPFSSTQLVDEVKQLWHDPEFKQLWQDEYDNDVSVLQSYDWSNDDAFWDQMIHLSPTLKSVYMTGGEPTLIDNNYRFLSSCIDNGYARDMHISFNTNCTNVTSRFAKMMGCFGRVTVNASIDAFGSVNDYIRYPSKWNKVDQNLRKLLKIPNVKVNVSTVAQIFNVMEHPRLLSYLEKLEDQYRREIPISYNILTNPSHLDMLVLPDGARQTAIDMLEQHLLSDGRYAQAVDGLIRMMSQPRHPNCEVLLDRFRRMTKILDLKRKNKFEKVFPYIQLIIDNDTQLR